MLRGSDLSKVRWRQLILPMIFMAVWIIVTIWKIGDSIFNNEYHGDPDASATDPDS